VRPSGSKLPALVPRRPPGHIEPPARPKHRPRIAAAEPHAPEASGPQPRRPAQVPSISTRSGNGSRNSTPPLVREPSRATRPPSPSPQPLAWPALTTAEAVGSSDGWPELPEPKAAAVDELSVVLQAWDRARAVEREQLGTRWNA
jgi:hypothetical protein